MSRDFDGVDDVIDCGSAASLDNINTFTYCAWMYPDTLGEGSAGRIIRKFNAAATAGKSWRVIAGNAMSLTVDRATTDGTYNTAASTVTTGEWQFVATTYSGTAGPKAYRAVAGGAIAEMSYATGHPVIGSGAEVTEADGNWLIGNQADGARTWDGKLAGIRVYNRILTLGEMKMVMQGRVLASGLIGWWELMGTGSPEPDWSGKKNNGTVTGAVAGRHSPISMPFGMDMGWMGATPTISVALTGVAGTGAVGTLSPQGSFALSGVSGTGATGSLALEYSIPLTGEAGTGAVGTLGMSVSAGLSGVSGTGSLGTLSPEMSLALTGVGATGEVGTLTASSIAGGRRSMSTQRWHKNR